MPKLKTRKSAAKRIAKVTSTGKILRKKTIAQHLVHRKSTRTVKTSGNEMTVSKSDTEKLKKLTPYR